MTKHLFLLLASTLFLGGCTLNLKGEEAASVTQSPVATPTPTPTPAADKELEKMTPTSSSTDETSIETDLNNTIILDEDFSDLE